MKEYAATGCMNGEVVVSESLKFIHPFFKDQLDFTCRLSYQIPKEQTGKQANCLAFFPPSISILLNFVTAC